MHMIDKTMIDALTVPPSVMEALLADFEANGSDAIDRMRESDPMMYLRLIATVSVARTACMKSAA